MINSKDSPSEYSDAGRHRQTKVNTVTDVNQELERKQFRWIDDELYDYRTLHVKLKLLCRTEIIFGTCICGIDVN